MDNIEGQIMGLQGQIKKLSEEVERLKGKRIHQSDLLPDIVKTRNLGEGNRYFYAGLLTNRPDGAEVPNSVTCYFAIDNNTLYIYNGTAWVGEVLS